jgi:hypothetical protein
VASRNDRDDDVEFDRPGPSAESIDGVRGVPGRRADGGTARSELLLSDSAHVHVEDDGADGVDALRRSGNRDGEGGVGDASDKRSSNGSGDESIDGSSEPRKERLAERGEGWRTVVDRMYAAYEHADSEERGQLIATSAENSHATNLASKAVASSSAISTRTLSRAVWLRSSRWVVLRRFRLTVQRPVLKAASPVGSAVRLAVRATQAVDGRAWRRPIHRALRITHTVSMALMGLTSPLASRRAPPKPHAACRRSRRLATSTYCNLMAAYRN